MRLDTVGAWALSLAQGALDGALTPLYGAAAGENADEYTLLLDAFSRYFPGDERVALMSAPGRTELGGNHTDHQHGCVLAAAVSLDIKAVAAANGDMRARIKSWGNEDVDIDLSSLDMRLDERGSSAALVRGVAAGLADKGFAVGGFDAVLRSSIPTGAGLSSSAAFEVLIATVLSEFYNQGSLSPMDAARISQRAENEYFKKPCGLMDQTACAGGGVVAIDFKDPASPVTERIGCDLTSLGYTLCVTETGASHADLTEEYAAIPREMRSVAQALGAEYLRDASETEFYGQLASLRRRCGDRACLRAMHFFDENRRAQEEAKALRAGDAARFAALMNESGASSALLLQNLWAGGENAQRGVALALAMSKRLLEKHGGAWRVHGGGFVGTILALVPLALLDEYKNAMDAAMGRRGACMALAIRPVGGVALKGRE